MTALTRSIACLALLVPASALAKTAAVPPLVAKGVDPLVNLNLTSLISSEAEFMPEFDEVKQLDEAPKTLNTGCLASTSCLAGISRAAGTDTVIAGEAIPQGSDYAFKLVYYNLAQNKIVRTTSFTLPNSPAAIADGMGPQVRQLVTGQAPAQAEGAAMASVDAFDPLADDFEEVDLGGSGASRRIATPTGSGRALSDDDLDLLSDGPDDDADRRAEEEAARRRADEEAARRRAAEEEAARRAAEEEARRRAAEEEARRRAEEAAAARRASEEAAARRAQEEAARRAEEEAARRAAEAAAAEEEEEFDFEDFELSSSTTVVAEASARPTEELDLSFDDDEPSSSRSSSTSSDRRSSASTASRSSSSRSSAYAELDDEDDSRSSRSSSSRSSSSRSSAYDELDDLDDDRSSRSSSSRTARSSSSSSRSSSSSGSARVDRDSDSDADSRVILAGRVGFAPYQGLGFVTYGAEVGYLVTSGLAIVGGVEAYSVQRTIPAEYLEPGEPAKQWNTILPLNAGLHYHIGKGSVRPYLGADFLVIPGYVRKTIDLSTGEVSGGGTAVGGRARVGANFLITEMFALNLNGGVGFLSGGDMQSVADGMDSGALAPQVSGGTVLYF